MDVQKINPQLRGAFENLPRASLESSLRRKTVQLILRLMTAARTPGVSIRNISPAGRGVRLYLPDERRSHAALFWVHGGGYIIGRAKQDDQICGLTAKALGIPVISAEYRLAPKHGFPTPLNDVHAAWSWLIKNAQSLGISRDRIAVGGESAGGGLAAALTQRAGDEGGVSPRAQWLFSPMLDDRTAAHLELDAIDHFIWPNATNRFAWRSYLGAEPGSATLPAYSVPARRVNLAGLPQTWIGVGDIDLFLEEDRIYAERLKAAGVETAFLTVPGAPHGFSSWAPESPISVNYILQAQAWLAEALAG